MEVLAKQQIIIGGNSINSITEVEFKRLLNSLPTAQEKLLYINARITDVLNNYLNNIEDVRLKYENYLNRRVRSSRINPITPVFEYEVEKYKEILKVLKSMLSKSECYPERDWQDIILSIILILFPKYLHCFSEVEIPDYYSKSYKTKRRIDLMLVDSNGNVDIIEIKKPLDGQIVSKGTYRNNHTPLKTLSASIMQIEKYIFHLNKWGAKGEEDLTKKFKERFSEDFKIKITKPKGFLILGRDTDLTTNQLFDFEIIKRKYSNIIDIMTYDDLIRRLELIIEKFVDEQIRD